MVAIPSKLTSPGEPGCSHSVSVEESRQSALPTMYDLPSESLEEPGLPDEFHDLQPQLLSRTLQLSGYTRERYFTVSDLNLYYDPSHTQWYKRADWFLAVDVPRLYEERDLRRSYVIWYEKKPPAVVVEFLSEGTEAEDLGRFHVKVNQAKVSAPGGAEAFEESETEPGAELLSSQVAAEAPQTLKEKPPSKLTVYEEYLRVPDYLVYHRQTQHLRYFRLIEGQYQEQSLNPSNPRVWLEDLAIGLGIWQGEFEGATDFWLRWCDANGNWLLTDTEQERLAREQEQLAREQVQAQLLQTALNLLTNGMTMEQVAAMMSLSAEQIQWINRHLD